MKNKVMLITYADSFGRNLKELNDLLDTYFKGLVEGIHLLPFYPSSADRGFAPLCYDVVDPAFGDWTDFEKLTESHEIMVDFMINHISKSSVYFKDFEEKKEGSQWKELFIRVKDFFPSGVATQEDIDLIYKRKPREPFIDINFKDGTSEKVWCTFDNEQVDLDLSNDVTWTFIENQLTGLAKHGCKAIRLDAFAYGTKALHTNCFFVEPQTWEILDRTQKILAPHEVLILPEIHEHYSIQLKLAERQHVVYDFALPMLVLHSLYEATSKNLIHWLKICPRHQFTTLDTHDGIGVVDVKDLMSDAEMERTREHLYAKGANVKKIYSTAAYDNLDIYQLNCTYYSALGNNDDAYLLARAIQFFTPGIPQIYYVGLLAGANDIELLESTKVGRNINRHYYSAAEISQEVKRPVVEKLCEMIRWRNTNEAFNGQMIIHETESDNLLHLEWLNGNSSAVLKADLKTFHFVVENIV